MQVLKFGGTSVANAANIKKIKDIVLSKRAGKTVVVVSALGGVTDQMLECGLLASRGESCYKTTLQKITERHLTAVKDLLPLNNQSSVLSFVMQQFNEVEDICNGIFLLQDFTERTKDRILSYGELISSQIISAYFNTEGLNSQWVDSRKLIRTNSDFTKAAVDFETTEKAFRDHFSNATANLFVLPGFIASDDKGNTTTLGRGGSDYTAAIAGAALGAGVVEIWTDVSGMMTADPRMVANAKAINRISYHEAMELSHFGAKVVYPPTIQPLMKENIPVWIKNTFHPDDEGTLIHATHRDGEIITGISSMAKLALLSLEGSGMVGIPGFSKRLFEALAANNINVILITQASSEHSICVGVDDHLAGRAKAVIDQAFSFEIEREKVNPLVVEKDLSIVALVGDKMKSHPGISGRMFSTLGRNGVNVRAIAQGSSERNISAVVATVDIKKALNVLHEEFFETTYKQVNLFIAGTGNVGSRLLAQIAQQQAYLQKNLLLQVRVVGLANSRTMAFNDDGINLQQWKDKLAEGEPSDLQRFIEIMQQKNLRNSVFVDITANESVAMSYDKVFEKSIAIVACNKIACSSSYNYYRQLKESARDHNVSFLFETNVGASLPIIGTLNDLLRSGDRITKIEAVLSGTLNFVFNNYNGERSFAEVVRQAQAEGYTEPDPRLDLSGKDVMRKIMILAREAGEPLEMEAITNQTFMPESCMQGSVEDFYAEMERQEAHFKALYAEAAAAGKKLKFVATYENGKAAVGLKHIDPAHDFYHLYGKDNIVTFYTNRYTDQPMVVKGAGAGAEVTASGVFADIIRTLRA
ncbi:bifunctional aspartate kinase/homoserine dehydrogenase I [Flavisolibacter nicotianae]|uniref:bifunctional aspartate kinase/homoserine dehydrogenase I n=1 Tax=Flavisolibacter nicotianae TaxID=2364882 RepID=UPI000EB29B10|nr:bifunctional aspartate kinase/homoserine dehydrogenase I [Flavisolibacter nicotianae]